MKKTFFRYLMLAAVLTFAMSVSAQTVKIRTQHKVKKSETVYGIARQYDITTQDLEAANPEMTMPGYTLWQKPRSTGNGRPACQQPAADTANPGTCDSAREQKSRAGGCDASPSQ